MVYCPVLAARSFRQKVEIITIISKNVTANIRLSQRYVDLLRAMGHLLIMSDFYVVIVNHATSELLKFYYKGSREGLKET